MREKFTVITNDANGLTGTVRIENAKLWWPYLMNEVPGYMYTLEVHIKPYNTRQYLQSITLYDVAYVFKCYRFEVFRFSFSRLAAASRAIIKRYKHNCLLCKSVIVSRHDFVDFQFVRCIRFERRVNQINNIGLNAIRLGSRPLGTWTTCTEYRSASGRSSGRILRSLSTTNRRT